MNRFGKEEGRRLAQQAHQRLLEETRERFFNGEWVDWVLWMDADLDDYDPVCEERSSFFHDNTIRLKPAMLEKMRAASAKDALKDQSE